MQLSYISLQQFNSILLLKLTLLHQKVVCAPTVILFGYFYRLIWESVPIQKWPLFSQFHVCLVLIFPIFMIYFAKCEGKGCFPKFQIKSLAYIQAENKKRKKKERKVKWHSGLYRSAFI